MKQQQEICSSSSFLDCEKQALSYHLALDRRYRAQQHIIDGFLQRIRWIEV